MSKNCELRPKSISGFYRGRVVKHLTHGKCKIFIPSVHDVEWENKPDILPDAELAAALFGGTCNGNGTFSYPNLSSIVWCFFENNDLNYPVYFAASLGSENAFGQYEIIMPPRHEDGKELSAIISSDILSNKHLITSEHTQVELYECGKISAYVSEPKRNDSVATYVGTYQLETQDDHLSVRPVVEKIDSKEISSKNCQLVVDVNENKGEISASTHYFLPIAEKTITLDENTGITTTYVKKGTEEIDTHCITQNELNNVKNAISSINYIEKYDAVLGDEVLTSYSYLLDNNIENVLCADGDSTMILLTKKSINLKFIDIKPKAKTNILISELCSNFKVNEKKLEINNVEIITTQQDTEKKLTNLTSDVDNSIHLNHSEGIDITNIYDYLRTDKTGTNKEENHTTIQNRNTDGVTLDVEIKSVANKNGSEVRNTEYQHKVHTTEPSITQELKNNLSKTESSYKSKLDCNSTCALENMLKDTKTTTIEKYDCTSQLIKFEIDGVKNAKLTFDSNDGTITLDATTALVFNIGGTEVMKITKGLVAITGELTVTDNITTLADVNTNQCTLNNHVHPYTWTDAGGNDDTGVGK